MLKISSKSEFKIELKLLNLLKKVKLENKMFLTFFNKKSLLRFVSCKDCNKF